MGIPTVYYEGHLARPTQSGGIPLTKARQLHSAGEWVSMQFALEGKPCIAFDGEEKIELRYFDARDRLVLHHRFQRVGVDRLFLDWVEGRHYDDALDAVIRTRSWRLFSTGEIAFGEDDRVAGTCADVTLDRQNLTAFFTQEPPFGEYRALVAFRPPLPIPAVQPRSTGM